MAAVEAVPQGRRATARVLGWFVAANAALAAVVGLRTVAGYDLPAAPVALLYTLLAYVGHYATLTLLGLAPALLLAAAWPRWSVARPLAVVLGAVLLTALVVDGNVFAEQRYHLTPLTVAIFAPATWVYVAVIGLTALVFEWLLAGAVARFVLAAPARGGGWLLAGLAAGWLTGQAIHMYADAVGDTAVTALTR